MFQRHLQLSGLGQFSVDAAQTESTCLLPLCVTLCASYCVLKHSSQHTHRQAAATQEHFVTNDHFLFVKSLQKDDVIFVFS